jgi:serine phosphatase RsbU (regulator of sigma subunit)/pSer/pThr/pTyr-binding forkhead associated (FHA) protein
VPVLRVIEGSQAGQALTVAEKAVIGRAADCDVVISSAAVSRKHARLEKAGERYYVRDLESRNGVQVNQRLIGRQAVELQDGDRIRLADVVIAFQEKASKEDTVGNARLSTEYAEFDREERADDSTIAPAARAPARPGAAERLQALLAFGRRLFETQLASGDLDAVSQSIVTGALDVLPQADAGYLFLRDDDRRRLRMVAERARRGVMLDAAGVARMAESTMRTGEAEWHALAGRSYIGAPLVDPEQRAIGAIVISSPTGWSQFDATDEELLRDIARQAGYVIGSVRSRERLVAHEYSQRDIELARQVQRSFLPKSRPDIEGYEIADFFESLGPVGGDYYDYFTLPDGRAAIAIGDVAGRGVPAALVMARISASLPLHLAYAPNMQEAMSRLNAELLRTDPNRFVTLLLLAIDTTTHEIASICAGHLPPLRITPQGQTELIGQSQSAMPLGVVSDARYEIVRFTLAPGESLVLVTDGIQDALDPQLRYFGTDRLRETLRGGLSAEEQKATILQRLAQWRQTEPWRDDVTLICLRRTAREVKRRIGGGHPLFDKTSNYARLRAALSPADKLLGYFLYHSQRPQEGDDAQPGVAVFAAGSSIRPIAAAGAECRIEAGAQAERRFVLRIASLAVDDSFAGAEARAMIVEPKAMARLRGAEPAIHADSDAQWFAAALEGEAVERNTALCRILSALPEIEARVTTDRRIEFVAPAPPEATAPGSGSLIVVIIDG